MKKYIEIYNYYKNLIITNQLKGGDRLPSVRKATEILRVSKTTIQNAYFALQADGYIIANPKSGYYVTEQKHIYSKKENDELKKSEKTKYDFKSGDADKDSFNLKLWQRYMRNALRQQERLLSYGDVQGESDLREILSDYIRIKRNVTASADRIVVGAGVQSLLTILCSLIKDKETVSFPNESFVNGINLFKDYGFDVHTRYKDAKIIYVSPSHMTSYGDVMPIKRRLELINYTQSNSTLIIEDDYDSDFLYQAKPTPSLYALSGTDNVVYMGSFSNVLIPGIRISFMVLTDELAKQFKKNKNRFAQTASKTEQIALCQYIRDGHINSQTRKIRRHYTNKTKIVYEELKKEFPQADVSLGENGLQVKIGITFSKSTDIFEQNGVAINIISHKDNYIKLALIPSAINENELDEAIETIKSILK